MKNNNLTPIDNAVWLTSIIELTEYKDYILLTAAFLEKLNSIPGVQHANIYEVYGEEDIDSADKLMLKDVTNILSEPVPFYKVISQYAFNSVIDEEAHFLQPNSILQTVFPVQSTGVVRRVLVIDFLGIHSENWAHITFSLRIYSNLLNIIDEKDRDQLTGLLNRYTFDNNLENIINYSKMQAKQSRGCDDHAWISIFDIDHFKKVNDTYGHIVGDGVLLMFSQLMLASFRYSDIVFRFGGEEFVVVLTECSRQGAKEALNRFRAAIDNALFPKVGHVTVSAGYVLLDISQASSSLMDNADKALFCAKESGRNRVVSYEEFIEAEPSE